MNSMPRTRIQLVALAIALLGGSLACAEPPQPATPQLLGAMCAAYLPPARLSVVSGRVVNAGGWRFGSSTSSTTSGDVTEQAVYQGSNDSGSFHYERKSPQEEFLLELNSQGEFRFRRVKGSAGDAKFVPVELLQTPGDWLSLGVGPQGRRKVYRAPTLWHFLLAYPGESREHLIPILQALQPRWQLAQQAAAIESELLKLAGSGVPDSERQQWVRWVEQLGDARFMRREAADEQLRASGPAGLGYLKGLDPRQLDAEQQFRLRRIVASLSQRAAEDAAGPVAAALLEDPLAWLALLSRPEEATRRKAVRRLTAILGRPIAVDTAADPASQSQAVQQLREEIERKAGAKPGDSQKPAEK